MKHADERGDRDEAKPEPAGGAVTVHGRPNAPGRTRRRRGSPAPRARSTRPTSHYAAWRAPRSYGCTVEEYFYFHRAALARCCAFNSSTAQSLRGSRLHQPPPCRPYGERMLELCRADPVIKNTTKFCTRKYSCLKIVLSSAVSDRMIFDSISKRSLIENHECCLA